MISSLPIVYWTCEVRTEPSNLESDKLTAPLHPAGQGSMVRAVLDIGTILFQLNVLLHGFVDRSFKLGESPLLRDIDLKDYKES